MLEYGDDMSKTERIGGQEDLNTFVQEAGEVDCSLGCFSLSPCRALCQTWAMILVSMVSGYRNMGSFLYFSN